MGRTTAATRHAQASFAAATVRSRPSFAALTRTRQRRIGARSTLGATVSGSPITGAQLSSSDHRPQRLYQPAARASVPSLTGNHRRRQNPSNAPASIQVTTDPATLPTLATVSSRQDGWSPATSRAARTNSDWVGSSVAVVKAAAKSRQGLAGSYTWGGGLSVPGLGRAGLRCLHRAG